MALTYQISYSGSVLRRLTRLDPKTRGRIVGKIEAVAADPTAPNSNLDHMTGTDGYRLRIGGWRVVFDLHHQTKTMQVQRIRTRGDAYKKYARRR